MSELKVNVQRAVQAATVVVQYATDVKNLLFLARLEFSRKTGCVQYYFQYKEVTFLSFCQNLGLQFFIRFSTSVTYFTQG